MKNLKCILISKIPSKLLEKINNFKSYQINEKTNCATRKSSEMALEILTSNLENLIGGSADLTGSNNTKTKELNPITKNDFSGRYIYYGVREHAMARYHEWFSIT